MRSGTKLLINLASSPIVSRLLIRTLAVRFYRENTGFFFVLLGFGVGILRPTEHIYIIQAAVGSVYLLGILLVGWGLFWVKAVRFTLRQLELPEHQWIQQTALLPKIQQITVWGVVTTLQYLMPTFYISVILIQAIYRQQWLASVLSVSFLVVMYLFGIQLYIHKTLHPGNVQAISKFTLKFNRWVAKPQYLWFGFALLKHHPVALFLTKLLSLVLFLVCQRLYEQEAYDARLLSVAVLTSGFVHSTLMYRYHHFQHIQLSFLRNLPLSLAQRFGDIFLTLSLILLPEIIILMRYFGIEVGYANIGLHIILLVSILSLIYHSQLLRFSSMEKLIQWLFYAFVLYFFLIMFSASIMLLALINLLIATILSKKYYYHYESPIS